MRKKKIIDTCFFCSAAADFVHLQWWSKISPFYGEPIGLCWGCYTEQTTKLFTAYKSILASAAALEMRLKEK